MQPDAPTRPISWQLDRAPIPSLALVVVAQPASRRSKPLGLPVARHLNVVGKGDGRLMPVLAGALVARIQTELPRTVQIEARPNRGRRNRGGRRIICHDCRGMNDRQPPTRGPPAPVCPLEHSSSPPRGRWPRYDAQSQVTLNQDATIQWAARDGAIIDQNEEPRNTHGRTNGAGRTPAATERMRSGSTTPLKCFPNNVYDEIRRQGKVAPCWCHGFEAASTTDEK